MLANKSSHYAISHSKLNTEFGVIITLSDHQKLYFVGFEDQKGIEKRFQQIKSFLAADILLGDTPVSQQTHQALSLYFSGESENFDLPISMIGTDFQKQVWQALLNIGYGQTCAYKDIALMIEKPLATRAVANAIGANFFSIIVPCHRIVQKTGALGGYSGGIKRKKWLLDHENKTKM